MQTLFDTLVVVAVLVAGFGSLVFVGWILTRLRGGDGPLTPMDQHTASDHLRSQHF